MNKLDVSCIGIAFLVLSITGGCGKPDPSQRFQRPDQVTDFPVLFGKNCSGCHGMDGQLGPAPPLHDSLFQAIISDDQLASVIRNGREGTLMPAFAHSQGGPLTEQQVSTIVRGIRQQWGKPNSRQPNRRQPSSDQPQGVPAYQVASVDPAGLAHSDVAAGQKLFADVCSGCHGDHGQGTTMAGGLRNHALSTLLSDQLLRRIIITGRVDLGMPSYVDSGNMSSLGRPLTSNEIINLTGYLRSLQGDGDKRVVASVAKSNEEN